jgi:hypothetical protein
VELVRYGPRLVGFSLNYRTRIDGEWQQVMRIDTTHGRLHAHRYWRPKADQIEIIQETPKDDYWNDYAKCFQDLRENWWRYRALYTASRR